MAAAARTYVDFVPPQNLVEETDKQTLVVDLSAAGFKKEHLRVQINNYGRLRISGERRLEGNKWSRFRKDFHVPEGCNASDIRARFDKDGVLHITMPMLSPAEQPKAPSVAAKTGGDAGHGTAQQTAAAQAEEEKKRHEEEEQARNRPGQEEHKNKEEGGHGESDAQTVTASTSRLAFGSVRDRSKMVRILLLAVALALVGAGGLYARYRLMDPSAETASADDHTVGLSEY